MFSLLICSICKCPSSNDNMTKMADSGTILCVTVYCTSGHEIVKWHTQPLIGCLPTSNVLISAATLFADETFSHMSIFAQFLNVKFILHTTLYNNKCDNLILMIMAAWLSPARNFYRSTTVKENRCVYLEIVEWILRYAAYYAGSIQLSTTN